MRVIKQDGNKENLIEFARMEYKNSKADLYIFDASGDLSLKYVFQTD